MLTHGKIRIEQLGTVDERISVHNAVPHKLSIFKSGDHRKYSFLLAEFEVCLKSHKIKERTLAVFTAKLYHGIGSLSCALISDTDRLHRPETHGIDSA